MTLFEDDDGRAYAIYSAEDNASIYICLLNDDFTDIAKPSVAWSDLVAGDSQQLQGGSCPL